MTTKIKKGDFVELDYTGYSDDQAFDTTKKSVAEEAGIHSENTLYKPIIICVGEGQVLKGLDKALEGKEPGSFEVSLQPEDGFGKRNGKLIQLIATSKFKKQGVTPQPGLQINIDGVVGTIKTVTGGRTLVDFNHPLSGKELRYKLDVKGLVTDDAQKLRGIVELLTNQETKVQKKDGYTVTTAKDIPEEKRSDIKETASKLLEIKDISFAIQE